jgi:hypothetical protein
MSSNNKVGIWNMKRFMRFALAFALALPAGAYAADMAKLTMETRQITQGTDQTSTMVWWLTHAFWDTSLTANTAVTPAVRTQLMAALDEYLVFAVARVKPGASGAMEGRPSTELLENAKLEVNGKAIAAVAPAAVKPNAQAVLSSFKPALAGALGPIGAGMEFILYPNKQGTAKLVDELQAGQVSFALYEQTYKWRLPLGSLLPGKLDPKTNEDFPGNYQFNPYTGDKLADKLVVK